MLKENVTVLMRFVIRFFFLSELDVGKSVLHEFQLKSFTYKSLHKLHKLTCMTTGSFIEIKI